MVWLRGSLLQNASPSSPTCSVCPETHPSEPRHPVLRRGWPWEGTGTRSLNKLISSVFPEQVWSTCGTSKIEGTRWGARVVGLRGVDGAHLPALHLWEPRQSLFTQSCRGRGQPTRCSAQALGAGVPQLGWHSLVKALLVLVCGHSAIWPACVCSGLLSNIRCRGRMPGRMLQIGLCPSCGQARPWTCQTQQREDRGAVCMAGFPQPLCRQAAVCLTGGSLSSQEGCPPRRCDAHRQRADQEGGVRSRLWSRWVGSGHGLCAHVAVQPIL